MWLLQNFSFFFRNCRKKTPQNPNPELATAQNRKGCLWIQNLQQGVIYLELVELEQVTVTATSEGGEEPALL